MSSLDLPPFRLVLDRVTDPIVRHAREYFTAIAAPLLVSGVLLAVLQTELMFWPGSGEPFRDLALFFVGLLATFLVFHLSYLALAVAAVDAVSGRGIDMRRAWRRAFHLPTLGTALLVTFLVVLSALACFLPVLFVAPLLALVIPAMVEEDRYGGSAISRSAQLVRFNRTGRWSDSGWMQCFVLLLVGTGISYAASFVVQGPFVIWQQVLLLRQSAEGQTADPAAAAASLWLQVPAQALGALVTVFVYAFWAFGLAILFFELRRRREAPDLAAAIDELVGNPATGCVPHPLGDEG